MPEVLVKMYSGMENRIREYDRGFSQLISSNFRAREFDCPCGCSKTPIDRLLVQYLEAVKKKFCTRGEKVIVGSGYRSPAYNSSIGGAYQSYHTYGRAADISIYGKDYDLYNDGTPVNYRKIAIYLESLGCVGLGIYDKNDHFIHIDTRTTKCFWYNDSPYVYLKSFITMERTSGGVAYCPWEGYNPSTNEIIVPIEPLPIPAGTQNSGNNSSDPSTPSDPGSSSSSGSTTSTRPTAPVVPKITRRTGLKFTEGTLPLYCKQTMSTDYQSTARMTVRGILWHSTQCNNPWLKRYVQPDDTDTDKDSWIELIGENAHKTDYNHTVNDFRANAFIGKLADGSVATIQTTDWDLKPRACSYGNKGSCNDGWIQIVLCEDDTNSKEYFDKIYEEACQLTAYLCKKYELDPRGTVWFNRSVQVPVILDHSLAYELQLASDQADVSHWLKKYGKSVSSIRDEVKAILDVVEADRGDFQEVSVGQFVKINEGAEAFDGHPAMSWMLDKRWKVEESDPNNEWALLGEAKESSELILNKYFSKHDLTIVSAEELEDDSSVEVPSVDIETSDPKLVIWNKLLYGVTINGTKYEGIGNDFGVAGLMGNIAHESDFSFNRVQGYTVDSDDNDVYTASINNTKDYETALQLFINGPNGKRDTGYGDDGYGLIQWDDIGRKTGLFKFTRDNGRYIDDPDCQIAYVLIELRDSFGGVLSVLKTATTIEEATLEVLHRYEMPDKASEKEAERISSAENAYVYCSGACPHLYSTTINSCSPSCTCDGYSGDVVCSSCGEVLRYGKIEPALGHTLDPHNGVCTVCGYVDWTYTPDEVVTRNDLRKLLDILYPILNR